MVAVNERERRLLEKIAAEGKATKIAHDELRVAKVLEGDGLLFLVGDESAIITPKDRRLLAKEAKKPKRDTPPFSSSPRPSDGAVASTGAPCVDWIHVPPPQKA